MYLNRSFLFVLWLGEKEEVDNNAPWDISPGILGKSDYVRLSLWTLVTEL